MKTIKDTIAIVIYLAACLILFSGMFLVLGPKELKQVWPYVLFCVLALLYIVLEFTRDNKVLLISVSFVFLLANYGGLLWCGFTSVPVFISELVLCIVWNVGFYLLFSFVTKECPGIWCGLEKVIRVMFHGFFTAVLICHAIISHQVESESTNEFVFDLFTNSWVFLQSTLFATVFAPKKKWKYVV